MFLTAFIMGLAGSVHCLGMCSPLIMAATNYRQPFFYYRLLYNGGRILMYGLMGMAASAFGSIFQLNGFQTILTFILGGILLFMGVTGIKAMQRIPGLSSVIQTITFTVKRLFSSVLKKKTISSYFLLGTLNGLLPCGLTYLALTYCFILPGYLSGFLFMIFFGLGTLGVMLGFTSVLKFLISYYHISLKRFSTLSMIILGIVLIARGALEHHTMVQPSTSEIVICK